MEEEKLTSLETITLLILKEIRLERQIHQAQVAERCGKTASAWSKLENGENSLSLSLFFQACNALGVNPSNVISTSDRYASIMSSDINNKWYILHGDVENNKNDLLKLSSEYYSSPLFKNRTSTFNWGYNLLTLDTPIYNQDGSIRIINVFRYALDPFFRKQTLNNLNSLL